VDEHPGLSVATPTIFVWPLRNSATATTPPRCSPTWAPNARPKPGRPPASWRLRSRGRGCTRPIRWTRRRCWSRVVRMRCRSPGRGRRWWRSSVCWSSPPLSVSPRMRGGCTWVRRSSWRIGSRSSTPGSRRSISRCGRRGGSRSPPSISRWRVPAMSTLTSPRSPTRSPSPSSTAPSRRRGSASTPTKPSPASSQRRRAAFRHRDPPGLLRRLRRRPRHVGPRRRAGSGGRGRAPGA